jgi:hypothetical protein
VEQGMPPLAPGSYDLHDSTCRQPSGCEVRMGHCEDGLGGPCWYLAESDALGSYATLYRRLGCATPTTCDCASPAIDVSCQEGEVFAHCVVR